MALFLSEFCLCSFCTCAAQDTSIHVKSRSILGLQILAIENFIRLKFCNRLPARDIQGQRVRKLPIRFSPREPAEVDTEGSCRLHFAHPAFFFTDQHGVHRIARDQHDVLTVEQLYEVELTLSSGFRSTPGNSRTSSSDVCLLKTAN